jgi:hypothetical protein
MQEATRICRRTVAYGRYDWAYLINKLAPTPTALFFIANGSLQDPWCVESLAFQRWFSNYAQTAPSQWTWQDAAVQDGTRRCCDELNCYRMGLAANKPGSSFILTSDTSAAVRQAVQPQRKYPAAAFNTAELAVLYTQ